MSDRDAFREARDAGLKARHETREARAVRKAVAEEIAVAIEREINDEFQCNNDTVSGLQTALCIAREIGSRDPQ